jgi:hypothetical protein
MKTSTITRTSIEISLDIVANMGEPWTIASSLVHVEFGSLLTTEIRVVSCKNLSRLKRD